MGDRPSAVASGPARITAAYLATSLLWIVGSDWLVAGLIADAATLTALQTAKGAGFVLASSGVIYLLARHEQRRLAAANEDLERTLRHARVLHRLLRHNLRNGCDVIQNNLSLLASERGEPAACRARIERQTTVLADIAGKCQQLKDVVFDDRLDPVEQDLVALCRRCVADVRDDHPAATVAIEGPDALPVIAHPRLSVAVRELLENAVVHQDSTEPSVSVAFSREGDRAVLSIADDGPGLPDAERVVLDGGMEDTLTHSTGVGLWLVRFIVTESDGTMSVTSDDGTEVRVDLPTADGRTGPDGRPA